MYGGEQDNRFLETNWSHPGARKYEPCAANGKVEESRIHTGLGKVAEPSREEPSRCVQRRRAGDDKPAESNQRRQPTGGEGEGSDCRGGAERLKASRQVAQPPLALGRNEPLCNTESQGDHHQRREKKQLLNRSTKEGSFS